jgi:hypothetical protein
VLQIGYEEIGGTQYASFRCARKPHSSTEKFKPAGIKIGEQNRYITGPIGHTFLVGLSIAISVRHFLLGEVFGEADVTGEAREAGDDARGLDVPDGFDGAMQGLMCGVMWIGSGQCYR